MQKNKNKNKNKMQKNKNKLQKAHIRTTPAHRCDLKGLILQDFLLLIINNKISYIRFDIALMIISKFILFCTLLRPIKNLKPSKVHKNKI